MPCEWMSIAANQRKLRIRKLYARGMTFKLLNEALPRLIFLVQLISYTISPLKSSLLQIKKKKCPGCKYLPGRYYPKVLYIWLADMRRVLRRNFQKIKLSTLNTQVKKNAIYLFIAPSYFACIKK
ncbi:hypothetical protein HI914_07025 [Erysiphe necator]|nr:hypothetical protein HI914_07025 [Erysiphe necator]